MRKSETLARPAVLSRRSALGALAAGTAWLHGCGGGADAGGGSAGTGSVGGGGADVGSGGTGVAGISSGGTGSFTTGTVSGLGSIIVRDVRYDDRSAVVMRSDDGIVGALRPGMVVAIHAGAITPASGSTLGAATATRISYASEWAGRVDAVDVAAGTFALLGLTVEVAATAVIEGAVTQLAALAAGQFVEVHGYLDVGATRLLATRIEVSATAPASFRLSGQVQSLDAAARTFRLGPVVISYDATIALPAGFSNGTLVRAWLDAAQAGGAWPARRLRSRESTLVDVQAVEQDQASVEGTVTGLSSATVFSVDGVPVDASGLPALATLSIGAVVEVKGSLRGGVLVATGLEVKPRALLAVADYRFIGTVSNLDLLARTFTLQGQSFTYGLDALISVPGWLTGATPTVEVRAIRAAGQWQATEIKEAP